MPTFCTHPQGMLGGLQGTPVGDLHTPPAGQLSSSQGLFENPLFLGSNNLLSPGTSSSRGIVGMKPTDIAGHHIVYSILPSPPGGARGGTLVVGAVPLQHYRSSAVDPRAGVFNASDFANPHSPSPSTPLRAWLPTLGSSIAMDQPLLSGMRFDPTKPVHGDWTCPLRTMLLWSGQGPRAGLSNFVPYVPNPMRAGRMYSGISTPYVEIMNAHPTAAAAAIDHAARLHTQYWTTNGFCVYRGGGAAAPASEACALYSLARSVFDGQYRDYVAVFGSSIPGGGGTCIDQVRKSHCPNFPMCTEN